MGVGDVGACLNAVSKMFDFSCKGQNQSCSFNDVYQPALQGDFIVSRCKTQFFVCVNLHIIILTNLR